MTEALQKVTREMKATSADKYDVTTQGEMQKPTSPSDKPTKNEGNLIDLTCIVRFNPIQF